ncbi:hypothetical protein K1T71_008567 [Dendrolimus kikuchii]|uniref:Uncharacterized protein n=1 Tax=Dendrolimus kikuchii TaxID=765133 RepID=A0ACC1CV42_9NEOP|nr:hypothetical protein K1T71_008567 [Dendrolimus kikuchii]
MNTTLSYEQFLKAAKEFAIISSKLCDGWKLIGEDSSQAYLIKETFIDTENKYDMLKAQYVIFYNISYGVPSFSFNLWNSSGMLLKLSELRDMSCLRINEKDFYSVITQQEHPLLHKPYFIMHPCHTDSLLAAFKDKSNNIIVTFLGLITPLIKLDLPVEYGL